MHKLSDDLALFDFTSLSLKMEASHKGEEGGIRYLSLMECEEKPYCRYLFISAKNLNE